VKLRRENIYFESRVETLARKARHQERWIAHMTRQHAAELSARTQQLARTQADLSARERQYQEVLSLLRVAEEQIHRFTTSQESEQDEAQSQAELLQQYAAHSARSEKENLALNAQVDSMRDVMSQQDETVQRLTQQLEVMREQLAAQQQQQSAQMHSQHRQTTPQKAPAASPQPTTAGKVTRTPYLGPALRVLTLTPRKDRELLTVGSSAVHSRIHSAAATPSTSAAVTVVQPVSREVDPRRILDWSEADKHAPEEEESKIPPPPSALSVAFHARPLQPYTYVPPTTTTPARAMATQLQHPPPSTGGRSSGLPPLSPASFSHSCPEAWNLSSDVWSISESSNLFSCGVQCCDLLSQPCSGPAILGPCRLRCRESGSFHGLRFPARSVASSELVQPASQLEGYSSARMDSRRDRRIDERRGGTLRPCLRLPTVYSHTLDPLQIVLVECIFIQVA
jgi:hypothetical protein